MPSVVVVGAGVVGLATAFQLAQRGVTDIAVVERRAIGSGASGKSGAIVRTHYSNANETRLALEGRTFFERWADIVGGDCGFIRTGILIIASSDARADMDANMAIQRDLGIRVDLVDRTDLRDIDPALNLDDGALAAYEPEAGVADAMATCNGFAPPCGASASGSTSIRR